MTTTDFGLPSATLDTVRQILAAYPAVKKALIYGSRAKGTHRPGSDIDLTLIGDAIQLNTLGRIAARLDESTIPYQVDLSIFELIEHAGLRDHIQRIGLLFYESKNMHMSE